MDARSMFQHLTSQGYNPAQAAAIVGNIQQESSLNPANLNKDEGAFGLVQWRLDRRNALENFARNRGTPVTDPRTQLDFIGHEMRGSEARNSAPFLAATDLPTANSTLKQYIRYGDQSEGTRLNYANAILGGGNVPAGARATGGGLLSGASPEASPEDQQGLLAGLQRNRGMNLAGLGMGLLAGAGGPAAPPAPPMPPMLRRPVDMSALQQLAWGK